MNAEQNPINHLLLKFMAVLTLWFAGVNWGLWASFAAFVYSMLCIGEWAWKRILKPILQHYEIVEHTVTGDLND